MPSRTAGESSMLYKARSHISASYPAHHDNLMRFSSSSLHRSAFLGVAVAAVIAAAACTSSDSADGADSAAGSLAATSSGIDTGMAGMGHSMMAGVDRGPAKDADHEFLRMMSDHHQGLVTMMEAAMNRASSAEAKADAHELHTKQAEERDRMVGMIRSSYGETIEPTVMPGNISMNDSLQQKSGADHDRDMYRHIVMHHREGIQMIDRFMSRLQKAEVKSMAEKMRADQQREIVAFEPKAGAALR